jgi:hypothetical protein
MLGKDKVLCRTNSVQNKHSLYYKRIFLCMYIRGPAKSQMTFALHTILVQDQTFHLSNHYSFKYDLTPRLLGIILDEKIKFDNHIMHVERKANNSIHIIREIKSLANISRTKLLRIYNSLVRSIIEYGCPVWQITPTENMKKLDTIQGKGLSICLGLPATSGREAMEVEGNILPVDLRIEEIEVREIAKIQSKTLLNQ